MSPSTLSRAATLLAEALRRAPDMASWRSGKSGSPSRLAQTLIEMIEREGAHCESKLSPAEFVHLTEEAPDARWYRAVYRLSDGSIIAVHDQGADCAQSEAHVLRHPSGQFAGVWDGESSDDLARSFASALKRLPQAQSDEEAQALADSIDGANLNHDAEYPLSEICGVIHVAEDGSAVLATREGVLRVPGSAAEIKGMLEHAYACMDRMSSSLNISKDEMIASLNPSAKLYMEAYKAFEANASKSAREVLSETGTDL